MCMKNVLEEIMDLMKDAGTRQIETGVPGLSMIKGAIPHHQLAALYEPMIGFTVQGRKILSIGGAQHGTGRTIVLRVTRACSCNGGCTSRP
ncbi:AraC family transcriptional regulator N-terminal domain-containing protein [Paenibacillus rhizoplanae]|uniref:AraC family transcriptional regulator N-terminal domain-containing protein n=1 Tax=Paenibacillus rhizoplanae TaxID=1917181 RepID=UPI00360AB7B1